MRKSVLMNLIWNIDSKQSKINETVGKMIVTVKYSNSWYNNARGVVKSDLVSDLRSESKGSWFESGC